MLIRDSGIIVPDTYPSYNDIKRNLTYSDTDFAGRFVTFDMYETLDDHTIRVPRFYPIHTNFDDRFEIGDNINIKDNVVPRSESQKKSIKYLIDTQNCILKLEPGRGKTVITIAAICRIGKKAIVFVHKDSLRRGWYEEFLKHTNATEDDVVILNTKDYKEQLKKPIVISTVQTFVSGLKKQEFVNEFKTSKFGIAVFDECHTTVGPEQFTKASLNVNAARIFGLSATPVRFIVPEILNWHCGEIKYFEPDENELLKPIVYMCYFPFGIWKRYHRYINYGGNFQYARYYKQMEKIQPYFDKVVPLIKNAYQKINRKILVMGQNVAPLIKLAEQCEFEKESIGIFIPSATKDQKASVSDENDIIKAFKEKDVVFSTYGACRDGNNRPVLDCLIMSTPTGNVEQAGGRICRPLEGKSIPIIIDLVDTEGPLKRSLFDDSKQVRMFVKAAEKRQVIYKELGWEFKIRHL